MPETIFSKIIARQIPAKIVFEDEHYIVIEDINPARPAVQHWLDTATAKFDPHFTEGGSGAAVKLLGRIVEREALVLTFNDVMLLIGAIFLIGLVMIPILKRPGASPLRN